MHPNRNIVITSGEPAGIGPDICLDIDTAAHLAQHDSRIFVLGDPALLEQRRSMLGKPVSLAPHPDLQQALRDFDGSKLNIISVALPAACEAGTLDAANSPYVLDMLDTAIGLCLQGQASGMVTGPIHKRIISELGLNFTGHTEYLAEKASAASSGAPLTPVMMLATDSLRVALATTHLPLKDVSDAIDQDMLIEKLTILHDFLVRHAGISQPRILVCGLNPHAGEDGTLGTEEITTILPALNTLRARGMDMVGPLPADTLFTPRHLDRADAVFAMYHDQGLPVLKYSGFGKAVNVTLGLPFVRTSVDHGTALELAGNGKAESSSLMQAIDMACRFS